MDRRTGQGVTADPRVTVIGATRNARPVTRLTYASFRRHTPEPVRVLVADNGSTDGTLDDLRRLDWVTVFSLDERKRRAREEALEARRTLRKLKKKMDALFAECPAGQRSLLEKLTTGVEIVLPTDSELCQHSTALDWLAPQVDTPYFLLLDSDVEFLAPGWLSDLVDLAEAEGLAAVGEFEPGRFPCQDRLATYLLLLRTDAFRGLGVPFRQVLRFGDPREEERWYARARHHVLDPSAFDGFPSAAFYDTAAALFEEMQRQGVPWKPFPPGVAAKFRHLGQMSWSADAHDDYVGVELLRAHVRVAGEYARTRLRDQYDGGLPGWQPC
ncbi:glycosyltransferase family 2 protein [Streptomyces sp. NPDC051310]|uniref:glycosyltransferase family 2 protein n=1 Tax=Streptomyces sp. NPDC051310 TaxID=3365649 RepID=UPI0037BD7D87